MEREQEILKYVRLGRYQEAKEELLALIDSNLTAAASSVQLFRIYAYGLLKNILDAISLSSILDDATFYDLLLHLCENSNDLSPEKLRSLAQETMDALTTYQEKQNQHQPPLWVKKMQTYIRSEYGNCNLNVFSISNFFGISPDHASRTFKQYTGLRIMDMLHLVRIQEVKKLLSIGLRTKEIAQRVGYINPRTLTRNFKKYEGITPQEYKNAASLSEGSNITSSK